MVDIRSPGVLDSPDALVRLVQDGDEAAFARIVRLHRVEMVRVAYLVAGDLDLAREGVAATWPVAWNRMGRLEDASRLGPWLCAMAADETRDVVRHWSSLDSEEQRAEIGPGWPAAASGSHAAATGSDLARPDPAQSSPDAELGRLLASLTLEDRALLALRHVAGLTPAELGRAAGMSPASAMARAQVLVERLEAGPAGGKDGAPPGPRFDARLRAYANVPVSHVDIDAVAHRARVMRNDRRARLISLAVAAVVAAIVIGLPYLGESGAWSAIVRAAASPSPAPTMDAAPNPIDRGG